MANDKFKSPTLLEEALESWHDARNGLIEELTNIPAAKWGFRPAEGVRDVTEMARHILEVSMMMVGELSREDTDFRRVPWPKLLLMYGPGVPKLSGKSTLIAALKHDLGKGTKRLRAAGDLHMMQGIARFDGARGTRMAWLHHGIAQEMYHRGQLTLYARLLGLTPALTRRITAGA